MRPLRTGNPQKKPVIHKAVHFQFTGPHTYASGKQKQLFEREENKASK